MDLFLIVVFQYFIANAIFGLGFNIQYGFAGVLNLAYIIFFAIGAYADSILVLGSPGSSANKLLDQTYFFGTHLPYPVPLIIAVITTTIFALLLSFILVRGGIRLDLIALASVAVALLAYYMVGNETSWFNGWSGLTGIPLPLVFKGLSSLTEQILATVLGLFWLAVAFWLAQRCGSGPFGRTLRCVRENEKLAGAFGKDPVRIKRRAFIIGCGFAGLAGAFFTQITGVWSPTAWTFPETVSIFAAVILGGVGNNLGVLVGVALLDAVVGQGVKLLPTIGSNGNINAAIEWIAMGLVIIAVVWLRPRGLVSERKQKWDLAVLNAHGIGYENEAGSAHVGGGVTSTPGSLDAAASTALTSGEPRVAGQEGINLQDSQIAPLNSRFSYVPSVNSRHLSQLLNSVSYGEPVMRCEEVSVSFGGVKAVNGASLVLPAGRVIGLVGPNGAGKSTLINALSGDCRLDPGSGVVRLGEQDCRDWPAWRLAKEGVIRTYQSGVGFRRLTVLDNVMAGLVNHPGEQFLKGVLYRRDSQRFEKDGLERALEILEKVGLSSKWNEYASELSGGQLRLLELARAMMASPKVLLLDEPLAGINPAFVDDILYHLSQIRDEGVAVLLVEHELAWVEAICDEVLVMVDGRVVAKGSMQEIRRDQAVIDAFLG